MCAMACMERSGKLSVFNVFIPLWLPWKKSGSSDLGSMHECCCPNESSLWPDVNSVSDLGQFVYVALNFLLYLIAD